MLGARFGVAACCAVSMMGCVEPQDETNVLDDSSEEYGLGAPVEFDEAASSGCGKAIASGWLFDHTTYWGGKLKRGSLQVGGVKRDFLVELPTNYVDTKAYPLAFAFHGMGGTMDAGAGQQVAKAWGHEVISVYPEGLPDQNGKRTWNFSSGGNDQLFFESMVSTFKSKTCVDSNRVFVQGFSRGGLMSHFLACVRPDLVRASAPVAATITVDKALCDEPVPQYMVHGVNDPTVTVTQGRNARDKWLVINGCTNTSQPIDPPGCVRYGNCTGEATVTWCEHPGAHKPPHAIDFNDDIITFFKSFK